MSSRNRLVALVGLVVLGAGIWGIFVLLGADDGPDAADDARAYLDAWEEGDYAAMRELVVDPPEDFDDLHQGVVDGLDVTAATCCSSTGWASGPTTRR
jgi:hypothetical protein